MKKFIILLLPVVIVVGVSAWPTADAPSAAAYTLNGPKWTGTSAAYYVNPNFPDAAAGTAAQQLAAIQRGAAEWKSAGQTPFQFTFGGQTASTTRNGSDGANNVYYSPTDGSGALAICYYSYIGAQLVGFDIEFYDRFGAYDFIWATNPTASQFDIESVATHEFGHALGLGHSAVLGATMYPSVSPGDTQNRTLAADDISGVQSIYGTQATGTPSISTVTPPYAWIGGGTRISVTGTHLNGGSPQAVTVAGIPVTDLTIIDATHAEFNLPAGLAPGASDVVLSHAQGSTTSSGAFFYQSVRVSTAVSILGTGELELLFPADGTRTFGAAPALGFSPGINLSRFGTGTDHRVVPVNEDVLFNTFYYGGLPTVFPDFSGTLDANGRGYVHIHMPYVAQLVGFYFVVSAVTHDNLSPSGIANISNALTVVITP